MLEVDFLSVGDGEKSGDAIAMRFTHPSNGHPVVAIIDAGSRATARRSLASSTTTTGTLNVFYGIAALADSSFHVAGEQYVFGNLYTWGWFAIVVGIIQFTAAFSLFAGNMYGPVIAIIAATIGAIEALANVGGPHPWWSVGVFAVCLWVIHGIWMLGEPERV
jgi:hypothetical protein